MRNLFFKVKQKVYLENESESSGQQKGRISIFMLYFFSIPFIAINRSVSHRLALLLLLHISPFGEVVHLWMGTLIDNQVRWSLPLLAAAPRLRLGHLLKIKRCLQGFLISGDDASWWPLKSAEVLLAEGSEPLSSNATSGQKAHKLSGPCVLILLVQLRQWLHDGES